MLTAKIALQLAAVLSNALDVGAAEYPVNFGKTINLTDGTGANQANAIVTDTRTLAASANESLDLAGGLSDAFNAVKNFTKVKGLIIVADAGNTNDVVVGGAASNAFATMFGDPTDTAKIKPGGMLALLAPGANGYAVTAGTGDLLKVTNGGGSTPVTYTIVVIGVA